MDSLKSYGIDYQEALAPLTRLNTIRVLILLLLIWIGHCCNLMLKNAFLNEDLEKKMYIKIPQGLRPTKYVNSEIFCMVLANLVEDGLTNLQIYSRKMAIFSVKQIILFTTLPWKTCCRMQVDIFCKAQC